MFKGIITDVFFDLDHTLWDFEKNSELTFQHIFKQHNIPVALAVFLKAYVPINFEMWKLFREEKVAKEELRYQRLKKTFDAVGYPATDKEIHLLSEGYIEHLSSFNHTFPGVQEVLDYLRPNYKLHIITNGFAQVQTKKLKNANILEYFDVVVNSEMAGVKKPNPKIFKMALEMAKVAPEQALMIGDNLEADILGAKDLGFHTLHFNSNGEKEHQFCDIIYQLKEIKSYL